MASTLTNLLFHVVFTTKMRQEFINLEIRKQLYPYIGGIIRDEKGKLIKIGGTDNHVHILAKFAPTIGMSDMMRRIKGNSSNG